MVTTPLIQSQHHLAIGPNNGGSFLRRFVSLQCSNTDAYSGNRISYERLLLRVQPADTIERGDTPGQVLMLLELDTVRRYQLSTIAESHGCPAPPPQPWDQYIAVHHCDCD